MKCNNCGNVFDERKYHNICPKCGLFQSELDQNGAVQYEETGFEAEYEDIKDFNTGFENLDHLSDEIQEDDNGRVQAVQPRVKAKTDPKARKVLVSVCVLSIVASFIISNLISGSKSLGKEALLEGYTTVDFTEHEAVEMGEVFHLGTTSLVVDSAVRIDPELSAPYIGEGLQLVAVYYHVDDDQYDYDFDYTEPYVYDATVGEYKANYVKDFASENLKRIGLAKGLADYSPQRHYDYNYDETASGYFLFLLDEDTTDFSLFFGARDPYFPKDKSVRREKYVQKYEERSEVRCRITEATNADQPVVDEGE